MDKKLAAALKRDDAREAAGMHADDRETCYTHQCWATECEGKHLQVTAGRLHAEAMEIDRIRYNNRSK